MDYLADLVTRLPGLLVGLTFHEYAHALAAYYCGDPTAKYAGRLTLNPLAHLDPIGTLSLLFAPIGWAKPVPVNPLNYRRRHSEIIVSLAGVSTNLLLAVAASLALRGLAALGVGLGVLGGRMFLYFIVINVGLAVFNVLPIFPLDGAHVMQELLPYPYKEDFRRFSRYGPIVLMGLVFVNWQTGILSYPIRFLVRVILLPETLF